MTQTNKTLLNLVYLTLEAPREGQASYVHVHEIINGLIKQGAAVKLYQPSYTLKPKSPALLLRLLHALWLQACMWFKWRKGSVLYVRAHSLAFPSAIIAKILKIPIRLPIRQQVSVIITVGIQMYAEEGEICR